MFVPALRWSVFALISLSVVPSVNATAIFSADASARLTITDIQGGDLADLLIIGSTLIGPNSEDGIGSAVASATGDADILGADPDSLGVDDALDQSSVVSGSANPGGFSFAEHLTEGLLLFENLSVTDTFIIELLFEFSLSATASVDDPLLEFAFGSAFIDLLSDSGLIDEIFEAIADSELGPASDGLSDSILLALTLGPNSSDGLSLLVDASGLATSEAATVPEPQTIFLFALGMLALGARKQRAEGSPQ